MRFLYSSKKIYITIRLFLGIVFVYSGVIKLLDLEFFSKTIQAFAILPFELCLPFAIMISIAEAVFGFRLAFDMKGGLEGVFFLLLVFVSVLGYAIYMGYDIDCGCFGPEDPEAKLFAGLKSTLARDFCMIAQVIYLYWWRLKNRPLPLLPQLLSQFFKNQENI